MPVRPHVAITWLVFAAIVAAYLVMAVHYPIAYIWATYEDLYGEWAQTLFFGIAFCLATLIALNKGRYRWFFAVLAVACFYTFMEEISWGQRLFHFQTPDFFKQHNLQRETNLHNMLVGPVTTGTKVAIEYLVAGALFLYGVAYPLLLRLRFRLASWFEKLGVAAPPLYLGPLFLTAAWLETGPLSFNEAEVAEILIGLALAIMTLHYRFCLAQGHDIHQSRNWNHGDSGRLSIRVIGVVLLVAAGSYLVTEALYQRPENQRKTDNRLLNGYEKFAKRYSNYGDWDTAVELYLAVNRKEPNRTFILRRIADAYRKLDDQEQFLRYNGIALSIGKRRLRNDPESISAPLTLAYTYEQRGDEQQARKYSDLALANARKRVENNPGSGSAAYWLAKVYRQRKDYKMAVVEYRRASQLKPASTKYRREYLKMKRIAARHRTSR